MKKLLHESTNRFELLSEEIVFIILDFLNDDRKSFSLVNRSFYAVESRHRKSLKPLRSEHLPKILDRYPFISSLDFSCPRITDSTLGVVSDRCKGMLRSIDLSRSRFFTHEGLSKLVMNCGNLVEIDLSNATELRDAAAAAVAEARNLERLSLARCKYITDIGIGCVAVGCRKLKFLSLKWCVGVGDLGVGLIAVKCKDIQSLDLSYLQITGECLSHIFQLQQLQDLILEGCYGIDDDSLAPLKLECKSLQMLDVSSCENLSQVGLSSLTRLVGHLKRLNLSYGSQVDIDLADSLRSLSKLQSIELNGCQVTCSGLEAIGKWCVALRELSLSKCMGVMDEGLSSVVTKHKDMKSLDITCCRKITHLSMEAITNSCTSLVSLKMESCTSVSAEAFVLIGQRCHFIQELNATDNEIDDKGLKSLSNCSRLSSLKLGICLNITDDGLIHIGKRCPQLKEIDLYRSAGITDSGILAIANGCPGLEMINVAYCKFISDRSLLSLSKCSKLNTLEIRGCPLITSSGLAAIAVGCRQLSRLDIKKCINIDDAGMIPLAHFSQNLKQINMSYSSVTDVGLLSLASISCLQRITILHLKGLTPVGLLSALLACGSLMKAKLHVSFKLMLPRRFLLHLEARGCCFQWRDKVFKAELDPKCWKLQLGDVE